MIFDEYVSDDTVICPGCLRVMVGYNFIDRLGLLTRHWMYTIRKEEFCPLRMFGRSYTDNPMCPCGFNDIKAWGEFNPEDPNHSRRATDFIALHLLRAIDHEPLGSHLATAIIGGGVR